MAQYYYRDIARWEGEGGALARRSPSDWRAGPGPRQLVNHNSFWLKTLLIAATGVLVLFLFRRRTAQ